MNQIAERHRQEYGHAPEVIVAAPGRVNLIGEHTDYNDGFVFPAAIDRRVLVAASRRNDERFQVLSMDFEQRWEGTAAALRFVKEDGWANYPKAVLSLLLQSGHAVAGVEMTLTGDVPVGSGLSSSAALEVACGYALQQLFHLEITGEDLARLAQRAESEFVGVNCGIMDQFISRLGRVGHAMLLDCRSLAYRQVPLQLGNACLLITNSKVRRGLVDSEYNQRRQECRQGVEILSRSRAGRALRDFTPADVRKDPNLPQTCRQRCLHVVEENARVLQAEAALAKRDLKAFGVLLNESHASLRDLYQVSCRQLDWLVERAWETAGAYGSRMTGAGFGGCTVTLIEKEAVADYLDRLKPYRDSFGFDPEVYTCQTADGARVVQR